MPIKSGWSVVSLAALCSFNGNGVLAAPAAGAAHWVIEKGKGDVEFRATGRPSAIKILGKGSSVEGDFTSKGREVTGTAKFDLSDLNTGIGMRDRHMKEKYLEVGKYPQATLLITGLELPKPPTEGESAEHVPFQGKLSLHGKEQPVSGFCDVKGDSSRLNVAATFGLKIGDFGIPTPGWAGITMADDVQVTVKAEAAQR